MTGAELGSQTQLSPLLIPASQGYNFHMLLSLWPAVIFSLILSVLVDSDLFYSFTVLLLGFHKGGEIKSCVQPTLLPHKVFARAKNLPGRWTGATAQGGTSFPSPQTIAIQVEITSTNPDNYF